jgi:hypothetical protein
MRREHSWCSDGDISPCPSPVGSPMHAAALATRQINRRDARDTRVRVCDTNDTNRQSVDEDELLCGARDGLAAMRAFSSGTRSGVARAFPVTLILDA